MCRNPQLPITLIECHFRTESPPRLPSYAGSAWRGAFGHALRKAVCVARGAECTSCLLYRSCAYPYLFETPPSAGSEKMRRYTTAPQPFALRIEPEQHGLRYRLGLTLFGRAEHHAPYIVHALAQAGKAGLGRDRQVFHLQQVVQATGRDLESRRSVYQADQPLAMEPGGTPPVPDLPRWIEIRLETPLRLRRLDHLVTPADFRFADLFGSLLRRLSMLTYFHTDAPLAVDFAGLTRASAQVPIHAPELRWHDWTRYSSRQHTTMEMGGILGRFLLEGSDLGSFWPYLWMGQWTHAGKGATMGLGRYRIHPASLPDQLSPPTTSKLEPK